ncbi:hypothetical protein RSAG8_00613, partial [Rhizoctonia solani AG-8 WAC10335]
MGSYLFGMAEYQSTKKTTKRHPASTTHLAVPASEAMVTLNLGGTPDPQPFAWEFAQWSVNP